MRGLQVRAEVHTRIQCAGHSVKPFQLVGSLCDPGDLSLTSGAGHVWGWELG